MTVKPDTTQLKKILMIDTHTEETFLLIITLKSMDAFNQTSTVKML